MHPLDQHVNGDQRGIGVGPGHRRRIITDAHFQSRVGPGLSPNPVDQGELSTGAFR